MASMPPSMQAPDASADPEMDAPEDDMSQGYCIEICVLPDGTFTVDSEPLPQESAEENAEGGQETPSAPLKDIGAAFKKALMIFQNQGKDVDEEAAFNEGASSKSKPTLKKSMNY